MRRDRGAVAQLGERRNGIAKVRGSIPLGSTILPIKSDSYMKSALRKNIAKLGRFSVIPWSHPRNKWRKSWIISGGERLVSPSLTKMCPRKCAPIVPPKRIERWSAIGDHSRVSLDRKLSQLAGSDRDCRTVEISTGLQPRWMATVRAHTSRWDSGPRRLKPDVLSGYGRMTDIANISSQRSESTLSYSVI